VPQHLGAQLAGRGGAADVDHHLRG
jgi:hypothetical protein